MVRRWTLLFSLLFLAAGCSRPVANKTSRISIRVPEAQGKAGTMALTFPTGRKACFAANITGSDMTGSTPATSCSPALGVLAGFTEPGEVLQAEVTRGSNRRVDLYAYLKPSGDTSPCPKGIKAFAPHQLASVYLLGFKENLTFANDTEVVEITAVFPGETNHLANQMAMPASCLPVAANPGLKQNASVSAGLKELNGGAFKMKARVGGIPGSRVLSGGSFILKVK